MRLTKGMKKILSLALTGALVITGANIKGVQKDAKAADTLPYGLVGEAGADIDTPFTIAIENNGNINDWNALSNAESKIDSISKLGEYQVSATVTKALADITTTGALQLVTDLKAMPTTFGVVAETLTVGDQTYTYDDSKKLGRLWVDTGDNKKVKIGVVNQWNTDNPEANAFKGTKIPAAVGDVLTIKFKVFAGAPDAELPAASTSAPTEADASAAPSADASAAPTDAPVAPANLPYGLVGTEGDAISVPFTAGIDSWGSITDEWGPVTNPEATFKISKTGEYKLSTISYTDVDDLRKKNGGIDICTDLTAMPTDFDIVGETLEIDGEVYELDQEYARVYSDNGSIRMGICNGYNSNPWANTVKGSDEIPVDEGDVVTITFKVLNQKPADFQNEEPAPSPSVAPSAAPTATNACTAVKAAKKTVTVKRGKTKTITFKLTNTNKSAVTTDKITVKSSNKKVTAKVTKTTATKVTVKVQVNKKAKKKSKAKITLKVGKKSAKTTIKVK